MAFMQRKDGIGKDWANKILEQGYQADKKDPNVTTARVFNKKTQQMETVVLFSGKCFKYKGRWRGDMIK